MVALEKLLEDSRRELLDLSTRNRLLSIPVDSKSARLIHIHDEKSDAVFRMLVAERKMMGFLPGLGSAEATPKSGEMSPTPAATDEAALPDTSDEEIDPETGEAPRHVDSKLQTKLTADGMQRRLLGLYREARAMMEEQGVNVLYLTLGRLKWYEAESSDTPRHAPLIMVPVTLTRRTVSDRFALRWSEEDVQPNLSLAAKLGAEFGVVLPPFPIEEELVPTVYLEAVRAAVQKQTRWVVEADAMTLGFFSFAKFLMYRDLDARSWPDPRMLLENAALCSLLRDGFAPGDAPFAEDAHLDEVIPAENLDHVVDADGSQTVAIEMVRRGRNVVIQGPPGTGKSQSITNIIATAALEGKRVLFIAEKLAALQVVQRRLQATGLGALCLELHGKNANKRAVLDEIGRTWHLGRPQGDELESCVPRLHRLRAALNDHPRLLHQRLDPSGFTPFYILGALAELDGRGLEAGELPLPAATTWDADGVRERRLLAEQLGAQVAEIGPPAEHPWRGVMRETVLNIDLPRIDALMNALSAALEPLQAEAQIVSDAMGMPRPDSFGHTEAWRRMAAHLAAMPAIDVGALRHEVWDSRRDAIRSLVSAGEALAAQRRQLAERVSEAALDPEFQRNELLQARTAIAAHGRSWLRFLSGDYRRAQAFLRGVVKGTPPATADESVALLDALLAARSAASAVQSSADLGAQAFGDRWQGASSDWALLAAAVRWVDDGAEACVTPEFRASIAALDRSHDFGAMAGRLGHRLGVAWCAAEALFAELALSLAAAFGVEGLENVPLTALRERLALWHANLEALTKWNAWHLRATRAASLGLDSLVVALAEGRLPSGAASHGFDRAFYSALLRDLVARHPSLGQFDGVEHQQKIHEFRATDRERLALAKYRVLARHYEAMPPKHAGLGGTGVLLAELQRKRNLRPVRKLLTDAGAAVQAIKPVFMMSPLSVAQFLEPGAIEFDLLVIDEASQVEPVDALGAFVRAKQYVVVGDSRQLPPTRFFARLTSNEDPSEEEDDDEMPAAHARDVESILGLCSARGMPETMLRWHYRSRHQSLIAVSNREFYESRLFIVPSPQCVTEDLGLTFRLVEGGRYDRGHSRTNRDEANAICAAVVDHARRLPHLTLGVAAFSMAQQQAISDAIDSARRQHPDIEDFFHAHPHEPFFAKNLESVQGDERDVIFISVGYGPDANNHMTMNFGPLGTEGGERRLNVLISRARRQCVVFASFTADRINLGATQGRGVHAFKTFLHYAQTGDLNLPKFTGREEGSPFEVAVRRAVESRGFEVHPQVGVAGFFIDLAVVDPAKPGRYLLGIECDGAAYHSSRSARDRDRLRQAVLEDHGWVIHRIWSTDWFQRPADQLGKVEAAIAGAQEALATRAGAASAAVRAPVAEIRRAEESAPAEAAPAPLSVPYEVASFDVPRSIALHEVLPQHMADILFQIVTVEGPVHTDELTARVRDLWGLGRAGARIQENVGRGLQALLASGRCTLDEACVIVPGAPVRVRDRSEVSSAGLRKPEMLPPMEIRAAIELLVSAHYGAATRDVVQGVARMLGFKSAGAVIRAQIEDQIGVLKTRGTLAEKAGLLNVTSAGEGS